MKRVFDFDFRHILLGAFMFSTLFVYMGLVVVTFGNLDDNPFDPLAQIGITIWMYLTIPMCFYIALFTRFNNPFRRNK